MKYSDTVIIVFAKAPVPGDVNTRLIPDIGVEKATQLQYDCISHRLIKLTEAGLCSIVLYCMPDTSHDFFQDCAQQYSVVLKSQQGLDLGERMANAIEEQLVDFNNVIVVGTDAPALDVEQIENAIQALLTKHKIVIVPAEDGGYVLIGMNQLYKALFFSVPWGTDRVLTKTRANSIAAGLKVLELQTCWDIDRPDDYHRWLRISEGL